MTRGCAIPIGALAVLHVRSVRARRHELFRRFGASPWTGHFEFELDPAEREGRAGDAARASVLPWLDSVSDGFDRLGLERRVGGSS